MIPVYESTHEIDRHIIEMCNEFVPNLLHVWIDDRHFVHLTTVTYDVEIHWIEFCYHYLLEKVARYYADHHVSSTVSFTKYALLQKMAHDTSVNPLGLLYDVWKHPDNYSIDL
jgi:hypothetical protein